MKINYVSLCSGYGAELIAFKRLRCDYPDFDFDCLAWSEIEQNAIKAHDAIHPEYANRNVNDLTKVDWGIWHESIGSPHINLLFASTPCQSVSNAGKNAGMKKGTPTMRARFCCEVLKEYKVLDRAVQGIRRCESTARAKRYSEPTVCRFYGSKRNHVEVFLPILEWTDEDVAQFIAERGVKCHPLYYDEQGNFHVERRLGCIGCPLRSDRGKADFLAYPRFLRAYIRAAQIYLDTHPHVRSVEKFGNNAYNVVFHNLFFDNYEKYHSAVTGGMFPETAIDAKAFLEDYFKIDLTI